MDQSLLQISISLTEKGEKHWKDVVSKTFEYCRLLRDTANSAMDDEKAGEQKETSGSSSSSLETFTRIWDELCIIRAMDFHQTSPRQAFAFAPDLASSVRRNGTEKCISSGRLLNENKDTLALNYFVDFLESITPENCIIERCSKSAWDEQVKAGSPQDDNNCSKEGANGDTFGLKKEKWYGVEYHLSPIDAEVVKIWKGEADDHDANE